MCSGCHLLSQKVRYTGSSSKIFVEVSGRPGEGLIGGASTVSSSRLDAWITDAMVPLGAPVYHEMCAPPVEAASFITQIESTMVKVQVVVHARGLGPKEALKAWYSLFP